MSVCRTPLTGERVAISEIETWNACDKDGEPDFKRLPGSPAHIVPASIFNWWLWCRPGDLIVCDEVQFIIPRGTLGKSPPHYIKSLEIHRHYGVDFLFITQSPQLLDNTIRNLVGLHRHVRHFVGGLCCVYEWDHASNTERLSQSSKRWFRRKSEWFKLYKSTVAVVTPPSSGRLAFWLVPLMLAVFIGGYWKLSQRFRPSAASQVASAAQSASATVAKGGVYVGPVGWKDVPKLGGCYTLDDGSCRCIEPSGRPVRLGAAMCKASASSFDGLVTWAPRDEPRKDTPSYGAAAAKSSASTPSI